MTKHRGSRRSAISVIRLSPPSTTTSLNQLLHPRIAPMSALHLNRRLPVSCEPCRTRKVRCSRDNPPCGTCIRRRVPPEQCVYKNSRQSHQPLENSSGSSPAGQSNAELVARIERLEHSLQAKNQLQPPCPPPSVP